MVHGKELICNKTADHRLYAPYVCLYGQCRLRAFYFFLPLPGFQKASSAFFFASSFACAAAACSRRSSACHRAMHSTHPAWLLRWNHLLHPPRQGIWCVLQKVIGPRLSLWQFPGLTSPTQPLRPGQWCTVPDFLTIVSKMLC